MSEAARVLRNAERPPTPDEIDRVLGLGAPLWHELLTRLTRDFGGRPSLRWDGRRSGWCVPVKRAGRPFVTLTPRDGGLRALVVLGAGEADLVGALPLGERTREVVQSSPQLQDGRWLFLTVATRSDLHDLLALLAVKLPPTVRQRMEAAGAIPAL